MAKRKSPEKSAQEKLDEIIQKRRDKQAAYKQRRKKSGFTRVTVWVPDKRAEELRQIARAMCHERRKKVPAFAAPVLDTHGKPPGWCYLTAERDEVWLHMVLKANGAQWQNAKKKQPNTWRVRSDVVDMLKLGSRVVFEES